jgi:tRNA C32,U32 (ribose-2'-O)-methylase TrmJ
VEVSFGVFFWMLKQQFTNNPAETKASTFFVLLIITTCFTIIYVFLFSTDSSSSEVLLMPNPTDSLATQGEIEALLTRAVALMERAGLDSRESSGGGDKSNHGRKRKPAGHLRALLARSQASTAEVRALHGIFKELEKKY